MLVDTRIFKKKEKRNDRKHQSGLGRKGRSALVIPLQFKTCCAVCAFRLKVPLEEEVVSAAG